MHEGLSKKIFISFDYQKSLNQNLPYKYLEKRKIIKSKLIEESKLKMFQVLLTGKRAKTTCIENESKEKTCKGQSAGKKLDSKVLEKSAKMPSESTSQSCR